MPVSGGSFVVLERVDSTNNYAMQRVIDGTARHGDSCFAIEQTNGKGRRGRHWASQSGENIILSVIASMRFMRVYEQFQLSAAVALSCYDLFKIYDDANTRIKWPNDLFWSDRKAGGILIENVITGNIWQWSVIGIGININQTTFPPATRAVSLQQITGDTYHPIELAKDLHVHVMNRLQQLKSGQSQKLLIEYNEVLYKRHQKVRLKKGNVVFETTITGVSPFGQLQTVDTLEHHFDFDEVEWVL